MHCLYWKKEQPAFLKPKMDKEEQLEALINAATELTSREAPEWEKIAGRLLAFSFYRKLEAEEGKEGSTAFMKRSVIYIAGCKDPTFWRQAYSKEAKYMRQRII